MPLLPLVPILAQFLVSPDARSMEAVKRIFNGTPPNKTLTCQFEVMSPRLGFSLMHWSGFTLSIPAKQFAFDGAAIDVGVAIEITPKDGNPTYLAERFGFPRAPEGKTYPKGAALTYMGGYYAGPGEYRVRIFVADNKQHQCGREWNIKVSAGRIAPRMEPNQVSAVGEERWRGLAKDAPSNRLTIILDATPLFPRRNMVRLSSYDRSVLLTSLTTLLDSTKATDATVIAVDPRNRKIIYNTDRFSPRELGRLARAIAGVNLGIVSLETLRGPNETAFMETVLSTAQDATSKSEAVVFLGPTWDWHGKLTPKIRELAQSLPRPHYLGLTRIAGMPDNLVAQVVKSANGSVKQLITPNDFAKALEKVSHAK
ncbi:MAG: hypothetical protein HYX27_22025 [Acidobacteria bacterium]|nr:hypothetical protein [Acidobacteriota bacterium]